MQGKKKRIEEIGEKKKDDIQIHEHETTIDFIHIFVIYIIHVLLYGVCVSVFSFMTVLPL